MPKNLFKFLEKNEVVLNEELRNVITESFNMAIKEKNDKLSSELKTVKSENSEVKNVLREAAEEIKSLRTATVNDVEKEVKLYEEKMVNKISKYLDYKINEVMPKALLEAQAKLEVLEPLVESIKVVFETQGIKLNSKGFDVLREAKKEIQSLESKLDGEIKRTLQLEEASEKLLGKYLLKEKTEGMTFAQKKKVASLFEGASYDEIESRFDSVKSLVLNENEAEVKSAPVSRKRIVEEYSPESKSSAMTDMEKEWARLIP